MDNIMDNKANIENNNNFNKKRILLKFTGKLLGPCNDPSTESCLGTQNLNDIINQIKEIKKNFDIAIVIGGGNILRGEAQTNSSNVSPSVGHQAGMLATIINGLIIKDTLERNNLKAELLSSIVCPQICKTISEENIESAIKKDCILIFTGGTGAPFFTTDTNAVVRALEIGASEIFKCTNIDGVYSDDPKKNKNAKLLKKISYDQAISEGLAILDSTALVLAKKHHISIRVFNIFEKNSLINAVNNKEFGSLIS